MKQINHISIPTPCNQNWDNMLPDNGGRFCNNCRQNVVDFTRLSDAEIIAELSSTHKVCGRFSKNQLVILNRAVMAQKPVLVWQKIGLAAMFISAFPFVNVQAKIKPVTEQSPVTYNTLNTVADTVVAHKRITGKITNGKDELVGASVLVKGTSIHTVADINGNFALNVPISGNDLALLVTFIGYKEKTVTIDPNKNTIYNIEMKEEMALMGEVVIVMRPPIWKRAYYDVKRFLHKVF